MLGEARHQLDEVAGPDAVIELVHQDLVPGALAGGRRSGNREDVGAVGDDGQRPALDRRRPDLREAEPEQLAAKPGISLSITARTASGVTSRPVTPVPPVAITTSMPGSATSQARKAVTMASASSSTSLRATSL